GQSMSWTSAHGGGTARMEKESVMYTADKDMVELQATIRYKVTAPHVFLFGVRDPDGLLRAAAEDILRTLVATSTFDTLVTKKRAEVQQEALSLLQKRCSSYGDQGLGIDVVGLSLHDLHPPKEVVNSYYEVTQAMQKYQTALTEAGTYKIKR